jgi:hypothetical protein
VQGSIFRCVQVPQQAVCRCDRRPQCLHCAGIICEADTNQRSETPRSEPEILLPGEPAGRGRWEPRGWRAEEGVHRVYVSKVGPFGFALFGLAAAAIAALVLTFVIGAILIAIPIAGLLLAAAVISGLWRGRRSDRS